MKLSIFFLKTKILLGFLKSVSKLYYSIVTDEKIEFLKNLCFVIIREILPTVLVAYGVLFTGTRLKRYFRCSFMKTL